MNFENNCVIAVPCAKLWDYLTDIPKVATCLPGVEEVTVLEEGKFTGIIALKVGMVKLRLSGNIAIELLDKENRLAGMALQAADQRISGMIQGKMTMRLEELGAGETRLSVGTELNIFGKIGEFGQSIIKKKADQMMAQFAENVASGAGVE